MTVEQLTLFRPGDALKGSRLSVDAEIVDYTTWTKDELVALRGMLSDEGARPEAADAVDHEIRRRETELATSSDLSSEQDSGEHRSFRPREPGSLAAEEEPIRASYRGYQHPGPRDEAGREEAPRPLRVALVILVAVLIVIGGCSVFGSGNAAEGVEQAEMISDATGYCARVDAPTTLEGQIILASHYIVFAFHVNEYDRDNSEQREVFFACMAAMPQVP